MQDIEHPNPQSSDESSLIPTSEIVHVDAEASIPPGANDQLLIVQPTSNFQPTSPPAAVSLLIGHLKRHTQLVLGAAIGVVVTLLLGQGGSAPSSSVPLQSLALNRSSRLGAAGFQQVMTQGQSLVSPLDTPTPPGVETIGKQPPQLQFMDRFYFTQTAAAVGEDSPEPAWLMMDRFYFMEQPVVPPHLSPEQRSLAPAFSSPDLYSASLWGGYAPPLNPGFQGRLEVPPPPDITLSNAGQIPNPPSTTGPLPTLAAGPQRTHTLLGVIETHNFAAALMQTNGSSYSVRVGESIRRSGYVLTGLESDKAIFSDGQRTFVVNVGEKF
jgi:hypothetical protein